MPNRAGTGPAFVSCPQSRLNVYRDCQAAAARKREGAPRARHESTAPAAVLRASAVRISQFSATADLGALIEIFRGCAACAFGTVTVSKPFV